VRIMGRSIERVRMRFNPNKIRHIAAGTDGSRRGLLSVQLTTALLLFGATAVGQESSQERIGQFVEVGGQIGDREVTLLRNHLLDLSQRGRRDNVEAVLVVKLLPGASSAGNVTDVARVLSDDETSEVRTVAWIQDRIVGRHAVIALACHEIMMAPGAAVGDVGRGQPVEAHEAAFVRQLVEKRRNQRVTPAVAEAMIDPDRGLVRIGISNGTSEPDYRFVSPAELRELVAAGEEISSTELIREAGQSSAFTTEEALRLHFLATRMAHNDDDVRNAWGLPVSAQREPSTEGDDVRVSVIAIHDTITPVLSDFVVRETHKAVSEGANLLIYDIDSPGGFLISSEEIANAIADLDATTVTTVAWIQHDAISGAAVAALGCDQIIMTPDARIGDVGVIAPGEDGAFDRVPEKLVSPFLLTMESLAKKKGRPVGLLHAMVDRKLQVFKVTHRDTGRTTYMTQFEIDAADGEWVRGDIVPESRDEILLTLSGVRAHELQIAEAPCENVDELKLRLGIPPENQLRPRAASWVDTLVFLLNTQVGAFMLISLAIMCIYLEAHLPSGFFGILAAALFALFFWSRYLGGTAGTLELVMFVLGMGLLLLEIFVVPGFGVFGISGILLIIGSLVMASQTFAGMSAGERFHETMTGLGTLAGSLVTVIVVASALNYFLPSMPILRHLILTPPGQITDNGLANTSGSTAMSRSDAVGVGDRGLAASMLRPVGKATFDDSFVDVVSEGSFIEHGTEIEVVRVAGNRIVVRAVDEA